jgi:hypothetical protein
MRICAHQPVYLPSLHLFNKIALCDGLVLLGHCQFVKQSWHIRNQIRSGNDKIFLTVPVLQSNNHGQSLNDTQIAGDQWKRKHLRGIQEGYSKRPFFAQYFPEIEHIILQPHKNLVDLNNGLLLKFLEWLELETQIFYSENHVILGKKTDMLIEICKLFEADQYVSNEGSRAYLEEDKFNENGIQHFWQNFDHPTYDQGKDFMSNLSIIDALFNLGSSCTTMIKNAGKLIK